MILLHVEVEPQFDSFIIAVESGRLHVTIQPLRPRLRRWQYLNMDRPYHHVWSRKVFSPVLGLGVAWWGRSPSNMKGA